MQEGTEGFQRAIADFVCFHCPLVATAVAKPMQQNSPFPLEKSKNRTTKITDQYTRFWSVILFLGAMMLALGGFFRQQSQQMLLFAFGQLAREYRNQGVRAGQQRH